MHYITIIDITGEQVARLEADGFGTTGEYGPSSDETFEAMCVLADQLAVSFRQATGGTIQVETSDTNPDSIIAMRENINGEPWVELRRGDFYHEQ